MTVGGGGRGHEWDKMVAGGAGAGIVGLVCGGVHGSRGLCEMGLVECSDEGSSLSFYVPGPWAICGRIHI